MIRLVMGRSGDAFVVIAGLHVLSFTEVGTEFVVESGETMNKVACCWYGRGN